MKMDPTNTLHSRQEELQVLQTQIKACRRCQEAGYIPCAQPIVSGRVADQVFVIGQAPGHRSVANNKPWSGPAGLLLQRWLEQAGFPAGYLYEHAYLSSLTHCDPGKNPRGNGDRKPSRQETELCRPFLDAELRLVQPRVVLLVGTMAIETFFGKTKLEDLIGTYSEHHGTLFLPLPHPSGVSRWLNDLQHQQLLQQALQLLAQWRLEYEL
ncbi:uracil-DNA glycosylase [Ktedonobacter sp. SOSP1-85]|uniref:uracil-DNA glycosylase family protein n=1 Tax=Ktedonobacter sp. SOSP1-85 TaxID=2778367 RepID=UPI0019164AB5|nr:uracil-DNA glycosylase family protein [Ktedonobacter sp. SOSP1-85]GHO73113.1 uracil-DNA glycosylase [Ktedonobacter sp. SOSP1-85]